MFFKENGFIRDHVMTDLRRQFDLRFKYLIFRPPWLLQWLPVEEHISRQITLLLAVCTAIDTQVPI
jgi:hypothetical protein